ncbi:hypothetical protein JTE90_018225 [Oedothorax gibbosus]|uniref:Uncharacterized protein n=1 Tax=Oedothorax gibbosus TaxID=931172 RepID=A0AAV6U8E0_9ARAC|nr:hypothetical protein JTE90_018225 [Oedothorax gibbosus]
MPGDLQSPSGPPPKKTKKSHLKSLEDEVLAKAVKALEKEEDQYEVFGQYVASELKHLSSEVLRKRTKIAISKLLISASEEDACLDYSVIENAELYCE